MWATTKHRLVPLRLQGRVSSLDWFISIGLLPLSFAAHRAGGRRRIGVRQTLVWAGVLGGVVTLAALFVPGMRATEREHALASGAVARPGPERAAHVERGVVRWFSHGCGSQVTGMKDSVAVLRNTLSRPLWLLYLVCGALGGLAYYFLPAVAKSGPFFNLLGVSSVIAILVGIRLNRPKNPAPWYLFAVGQAFFIGGDVITYNYPKFFGGADIPFPSIGDVFYLAVYPCLIAGVLMLIRERKPGKDRDSVIDSLIITIPAGLLVWEFWMGPLAHDTTSSASREARLDGLSADGPPVAGRGRPARRRFRQARAVVLPAHRRGRRAGRDGHRLRAGTSSRARSTRTAVRSRPGGSRSTCSGPRPRSTRRCARWANRSRSTS